MNDSPAAGVVAMDDFDDDTCSCDSIYHSLINTPVDETPKEAAVAARDATAAGAASPEASLAALPGVDSRAAKDQRSHERARQQLKKPDDIRKAKRCVRCKMCKPEKWAGNAGRPKQGGRTLRASLAEAEGDRPLGLRDAAELGDEHAADAAPPPVARIVTLADFVKPARKRSDKQFEIVGRPRQVLAMDDFPEADSKFDLDEWEYVEAEAKHRKTAVLDAPTYARVVARA